jgi:hypothetical protein
MMAVPLDRLSHLVQVKTNHTTDADHRKVALPIGSTDGHHTEFQDSREFGDGQPGALHTVPFMARCGMCRPYPDRLAGGNMPVLLLSDQEWSGGVRSSEGAGMLVWWIMRAPSSLVIRETKGLES